MKPHVQNVKKALMSHSLRPLRGFLVTIVAPQHLEFDTSGLD